MPMKSTVGLLTELLTDRYQVESTEATPDTAFEDLAIDSLTLMELALILEKQFSISITEGTLMPEQTLSEAAAVLDSLRPA